MEQDATRRWTWDWLWFLGWGIASSVWCVTAASQLGATFDEPVYIARGLEHWRTGSAHGLLRMGTMPLPADLATLPLYLGERWQGAPLDLALQWEALLPWARATTLVFWWILLSYGWRTGFLLAGTWGARLAVALLACEPSLLAHASLATTDIAVTACVLALVYHFRAGREARWLRRLAVPTLWFGAAVLAKASGLVFGVLCLGIVELERLARQGTLINPCAEGLWGRVRSLWAATAPARRDLAWIGGGGLLLAFLYCGCDWRPEPSFVAWAHGLPEGPAKPILTWVAEHLRLFSNAGEGIVRQIKHNLHGHGAYLLGWSHAKALWFYFPVLLTLKLSLPLLLAPLLVALVRPRALANWACLTAAVLVALSLTWRVQIGIRLVLPVVALAVVGLAAAVAQACREPAPAWRRGLLAGAAGAGLLWMAAATGRVWPNGLCYVNGLWGGTANGYLRVSEANYDWGQGLPELARWQRQHGLASLDVWYFGTDPMFPRLPLRLMPLHVLPLDKPADVLPQVSGHYLAVSTTLLYGSPLGTSAHSLAVAFLRRRRPVARTTTFLIYDFTREPGSLEE